MFTTCSVSKKKCYIPVGFLSLAKFSRKFEFLQYYILVSFFTLSVIKVFLGTIKMILALSFSYEKQGRVRKVIKAQQLWYAIIESQTETGTPYMLYKDSCNRKSNQQNLGTIKCSNLCTEIVEYTSKDEVGRKNSV